MWSGGLALGACSPGAIFLLAARRSLSAALVLMRARWRAAVHRVTRYPGDPLCRRCADQRASRLVYFAGGGGGIVVSIMIFNFPPSRTYVAVQRPGCSMGTPLWFLLVTRYVPMASAVSDPNGQT
jgi:hypothetical protein